MTVAYTYQKYKDVHTLQNDEALLSIQYTVTQLDCDSNTVIAQLILEPAQVATLSFSIQGKYEVLVEAINGVGVDPETFTIVYYNDLLKSLIYSVNSVLCGCTDCKTYFTCNDYLTSFLKANIFLNVHSPVYDAIYNTLVQESICIYAIETNCALLEEKIYGKFDSVGVLSQTLAFYYLSFYHQDMENAVDSEEETYIKLKYNFDKISGCIKKLGVSTISPLIPN